MKEGEPVGEPLIPSLCSSWPGSKPSRSFSTTKALIRLVLAVGDGEDDVEVGDEALVIQFFWPLITHSSPSRTAVVRIAAGSLPASGSESAKAGDHSPLAHFGRKRSFSSSEPKSWIGSVPSSWIIRIRAEEAQALAISSTAICRTSVPVPVPP